MIHLPPRSSFYSYLLTWFFHCYILITATSSSPFSSNNSEKHNSSDVPSCFLIYLPSRAAEKAQRNCSDGSAWGWKGDLGMEKVWMWGDWIPGRLVLGLRLLWWASTTERAGTLQRMDTRMRHKVTWNTHELDAPLKPSGVWASSMEEGSQPVSKCPRAAASVFTACNVTAEPK